MNLLVIDDNEDVCEFMLDLLEYNGYKVITCLSGEEALEKGADLEFDVAFIDMYLPGLDGVEAMRELQKDHSESVYFLMSGYSCEEKIKLGLDCGASKFFKKPFSANDILDAINSS